MYTHVQGVNVKRKRGEAPDGRLLKRQTSKGLIQHKTKQNKPSNRFEACAVGTHPPPDIAVTSDSGRVWQRRLKRDKGFIGKEVREENPGLKE